MDIPLNQSLPTATLRGINSNYNEEIDSKQTEGGGIPHHVSLSCYCLPQDAGEAESLHEFLARPDMFVENLSMDYC